MGVALRVADALIGRHIDGMQGVGKQADRWNVS
jgi:hypothetical protein